MSQSIDGSVAAAISKMPEPARERILELRDLIFSVGAEHEDIGPIEESLKWGEPSFVSPKGSAVRLGCASKNPDIYRMFFHCQSMLVATFRELYPGTFQCEGNRAIAFGIHEPLPERELKHCIELALKYHRVKHLPLLGSEEIPRQ